MSTFPEADEAIYDKPAIVTDGAIGDANRRALHFLLGAQRMLFEEMVFVGAEAFDRALTEMHLFSEFSSKLAGAHSVKNIGQLSAECSQHQLDFVRRDCERVLKHAGRVMENASKLLVDQPQS